ncbi:cobalamin-dependent protein [Caldilinea sp.]|uniref:cobalamin-dependent protein n=1 Tax=Caldilinea sp. TaxID=2293560 RepID=UPI002BD50688|nr:uroporphyrinogen decarboxylase family protein [Caldilinea sp.]HRA64613.1 uroporphyrinogen decarboxylase family protein [Caldilinea sp.]
MNSRQRVKMALNHQEPDRIPFDLGGTVLTSIHVHAYRNLRRYLGLPDKEVEVMDVFQQIAVIDDDMRQKLGCDGRNVAPRSSATFKIVVDEDSMPGYRFFQDEWGISWRMPKDGGFYYDMFQHPFANSASIDDIKHFPWPDPVDPARFTTLKESARHVAEDLGEAVILGGLSAGFVELAAWTRGFARFYPDLVTNLEWMTYLMDTIIDLKLAYWEVALPLVGDYADVVQEADDLAGQFGLLISPETYRKVIKPRHKKIMDFIKARTDAKIFFHSCGAIREIIPDMIEIGIDIINPVQVSAVGMESSALKRDFGKEMTFWGGLVDTQGVFTTGTTDEVREEVRRRIDDFGAGGGFIAATVHNIQANVPPENIMALWETLQEYGSYGPGGVSQRADDYVPAARHDKPVKVSSSPDALPAQMLTPEAAAAQVAEEEFYPDLFLDMQDAIIDGRRAEAVVAGEQALADGYAPQAVISDGIVPAMTIVGERFESAEFFLPEMMAAALAARGILELLRPRLVASHAEPVGRVVIGTVKGDLHDIGKNLVAMMFEGAGFEVIDLGPDVPADKFIAAINEHKPGLVGLSALLTTTAPMMRTIINALQAAGVRDRVKVLVGGAAISEEFADEIGADGYAPDAGAAVRKAKALLAMTA